MTRRALPASIGLVFMCCASVISRETLTQELDVHLASSRVLLLKPDEVRRRLAEQAAVGGARGDGGGSISPSTTRSRIYARPPFAVVVAS